MFKMIVKYHSKGPDEFLCRSMAEGIVKLRTLRGYKSYRFVLL